MAVNRQKGGSMKAVRKLRLKSYQLVCGACTAGRHGGGMAASWPGGCGMQLLSSWPWQLSVPSVARQAS